MRKIEISSENNYKIDDDLILFKFSNIDQQTKSIFFETKTNFIQFHFCLKGECNFIYNNGSYCLPLKNEIS
ncbi:MAG: AraC family transcriptional regulator, partial [Bacteroidota bacterium]|nr:AraC family transcriptional regulator [Bacteroidota bacterium]